jgi:hypothetical protein
MGKGNSNHVINYLHGSEHLSAVVAVHQPNIVQSIFI